MKTLVILMGLPGSGKSTYSRELKAGIDHVYINQDHFDGNREKTWNAFRDTLDRGLPTILDRCNINRSQRSPWINYAKQMNYKIECHYLCCDADLCISRIMKRTGHKTIHDMPIEKVKEIVYGFQKSYQAPCMTEGFDRISCWRNDD